MIIQTDSINNIYVNGFDGIIQDVTPLNLSHTLLKQGTGTADHLLPLGCYFTFTMLRAIFFAISTLLHITEATFLDVLRCGKKKFIIFY